MKPGKDHISIAQAKSKIERYCNYQERCQKEVKNKLYEMGLVTSEVNELMGHLVQNKFLNEERFAIAFAGGKFRQKRWGRNKIIRELKSRDISEFCIKQAMKEIGSEDYTKTLEKTAVKYLATLKETSALKRKQKVIKYLAGRGFEYDQCHEILEGLF